MENSKEDNSLEVIRPANSSSRSFQVIHKKSLELTQRFSDLQVAKKIEARTDKLNEMGTQASWRKARGTTLKILMKEIRSSKTIKKLDFRKVFNWEITDSVLQNLGHHLRNLNKIQEITLDFTRCYDITNEGVFYLCQGLKRLRFLKKIYIDFWRCFGVTRSGSYSIIEALKALTSLQSVVLNFGGSFYRPPRKPYDIKRMRILIRKNYGPQIILRALKSCHSLQNIHLLFFDDDLEDRRVESFSRELKKLKSLQKISLGLCFCKGFSDIELLKLIEGLEELVFLKSICLYFEECENVTEGGIEKVKECLKACDSLREINFSRYVWQKMESKSCRVFES